MCVHISLRKCPGIVQSLSSQVDQGSGVCAASRGLLSMMSQAMRGGCLLITQSQDSRTQSATALRKQGIWELPIKFRGVTSSHTGEERCFCSPVCTHCELREASKRPQLQGAERVEVLNCLCCGSALCLVLFRLQLSRWPPLVEGHICVLCPYCCYHG